MAVHERNEKHERICRRLIAAVKRRTQIEDDVEDDCRMVADLVNCLRSMRRTEMVILVWTVDGEKYDCVCSPDDGGWYLQRHRDDATSQVFEDPTEARDALRRGDVAWEE